MGVIGAVLLMASGVKAEERTITFPEAIVYSGPSTKFYPTGKLHAGERVEVVQTADNQPGWLAIKPPAGSFSWIAQRFVAPSPNGKIGIVGEDNIPVLLGSSLTNEPPSVEKVKLKRGSQVLIVGQPEYANSGVWLPIAPPAGEVRYIQADAVKARAVAGGQAPAGPAAGAVPAPPPQPGRPENAAAPQPYAGGWQAVNQSPGNQPRTPGQTTSFNNAAAQPSPAAMTSPAGQPQYSPYGVLRKTAFQMNGQPMYVLEGPQGQPLAYVAAPPGFTLTPYVGRAIRVYGTTSYRSDDYLRAYYVTATHVALY
jgi:hypothetical protein